MRNVFKVVPGNNASVNEIYDEENHLRSLTYSTTGKEVINNAPLTAKITNAIRWVAISRFNIYWMKPSFGTKLSDVPKETQLLIIETSKQGEQIAVVPLSYDEYTFTLQGGDTENEICFTQSRYIPVNCTENTTITPAVFIDGGFDIITYLNKLGNLICSKTNDSFRPRIEKTTPEFVKKLGWCTWDAYYKEVDQKKILTGVALMEKKEIRPGYIIIDDGWLDVDSDYLNSFSPNTDKFDKDFKPLITFLHNEGIDIGVWHALNGYWGGLKPDGKLADNYSLIKTKNLIRPWEGDKDKAIPLQFIFPNDISRFYLDWYRHLKSLGVFMVKVDGQSAIEMYAEGICNRTMAMRRYQEAMQAAAGLFFNNNVIHCMSHGNDVMANMLTTNVIRNSDDYFPGKPADVQQSHVFANAMNAVFTSMFAIPDWDMFKSGMPEGDFHAAARAISGGPVYICDKPEEINAKIVKRLIADDGEILSPDDVALPLSDRIFIDCMHEEKLLVIKNKTKYGVVFGIFNVNVNDVPISEIINISDYLPVDMRDEIIYMKYGKNSVDRLPESGEMVFSLKPMAYELIYFTAPDNGVAPMGLKGKYIGSAAILNYEREEGAAMMDIRTGGDFVIYSENEPNMMTINYNPIDFKYDIRHKTVTISAKTLTDFQFDWSINRDDFVPDTLFLSLLYQDEIVEKLNDLRINNDDTLFDFDEDFLDDEDILPHGKSLTETGFESEEDMLKMIKEVMERMEEGETDNQPLRLLPQKKGNKRKQ